MSKRLQVVLSDEEMHALREVASSRGMTVAEWVRHALRESRRSGTTHEVDARLDAVRAAARHEFPAPDVEQMLDEIEAGYIA